MSRRKTYYQLGKMLGLSQIEIKTVLSGSTKKVDHLNTEAGPIPYWSTFYGTISIKDF